MASPYCEKFGCFATLDLCAERCGQPRSNRRPICPEGERRARQWSDLPDKARKAYHGNWELRLAREAHMKALETANWASEELRGAARRQLQENAGRKTVSVPIEALTALISRLDVLSVLLQDKEASVGIVEAGEASDCVPIGGRAG